MNTFDYAPKLFKGLMPFFGFTFALHIFGGKKSTTTNSEETTITQTHETGLQGTEGIAVGEFSGFGNSIEVLDAGAVNSAFDFAKESQSFWGESFDSVLGLVERQGEKAVNAAQQITSDFNQRDLEKSTSGIASVMPLLSGTVLVGGLYFLIKAVKG